MYKQDQFKFLLMILGIYLFKAATGMQIKASILLINVLASALWAINHYTGMQGQLHH